eukprot:740277_1
MPRTILIGTKYIKAAHYELQNEERIIGFDLFEYTKLIAVNFGWLLEDDVDLGLLCKALEIALNAFPVFSSRVKCIKNNYFVLSNNNKGIKLKVMCCPNYSLLNPKQLQNIFNKNNASPNVFFKEKLDILHGKPLLQINLIYLNRTGINHSIGSNWSNGSNGGCFISFNFAHIICDGYSANLFCKYLSKCMSELSCKQPITKRTFELYQFKMDPTLGLISKEKCDALVKENNETSRHLRFFKDSRRSTINKHIAFPLFT